MKNKLKLIYIILIILSILTFIFLIIHPFHKEVQIGLYDTKDDLVLESFDSEVNEIFNVDIESTFRLMFFIEKKNYDNLEVSLSDANDNEVFSMHVPSYNSDAMFFEFPPLKKGKYKLSIKDNDGDPIRLYVTKATDNSYLDNNSSKTLQLVTYHYESYYFYLWYPIFLFTFLFTIYPYIWSDKNEK